MTVFSVFLGGGIGSVLRWLVTSRIASHWGVMLANVFGAMLIGMASEYFLAGRICGRRCAVLLLPVF